jgi:hypothetical protein
VSRPHPRARLFAEEGGLVTGCDDVTVARELLVAEYLLTVCNIRPDEDPVALAASDDNADLRRAAYVAEQRAGVAEMFDPRDAQIQRGRIIPCPPDDEVAWVWRKMTTTGRGVTTAVVWDS